MASIKVLDAGAVSIICNMDDNETHEKGHYTVFWEDFERRPYSNVFEFTDQYEKRRAKVNALRWAADMIEDYDL